MANQRNAPALDLSTTDERPIIRIDKVDYDLRIVDDFVAIELHTLDRLMPRVLPLARKLETGKATAKECEELSTLLDQLLAIVLDAPEPIRAKLGDTNKVRVFQVFMELLPETLAKVRAVLKQPASARGLAGAQSSQAFRNFTAGKSKPGQRKSRSA